MRDPVWIIWAAALAGVASTAAIALATRAWRLAVWLVHGTFHLVREVRAFLQWRKVQGGHGSVNTAAGPGQEK
jgi:hypothetical protein